MNLIKELIGKSITKYNNTWTITSHVEDKIYIVKKNKEEKEYILKIEEHSSGPLFCEIRFYIRLKKEIESNKNIKINVLLPLEFGLDIKHNNIKYRNVILEKKKKILFRKL